MRSTKARFCRRSDPELHRKPNVGAGLPAIAECQSLKMLTGLPLSQASQLPHLFCVVFAISAGLAPPHGSAIGAGTDSPGSSGR
ncbi:hypothetical protein FFI16_026380 [Pseudomonas sp. KBS0710]|nr:hypothetical protein FFI16_026380 [Pseudomonas sp. KBS0710]